MDRRLNRRSLVMAASTATGLAIAPRVIGAQVTPAGTPSATVALPTEHADAMRAAIAGAMEENGIPGAAVSIGLPGYEPFVEPFGVADKAAGTPVTRDMHFRIGSITKTFTGTVILQLVDEGELSLDDTIDTWEIQVPNADVVTVRHLLNMTSGLQSYTQTEEFSAAMNSDPSQHIEPEDLIAMSAGEPLSKPGERFHYNNTNFIILGLIAEKVTGLKLDAVLQTRVFDAVGLANSGLGMDATLPEPFARGYGVVNPEVSEEGQATTIATPMAMEATPQSNPYPTDEDGQFDASAFNPVWAWAAGAAWSTVDDLAIWIPALLSGATLSPEMAEERMEWVVADPSMPAAGAYGLAIANLGGMIGHNGSIAGYSSLAVTDPASGLTTIVLANLNPGSSEAESPDIQIVNAAIEAARPLLEG